MARTARAMCAGVAFGVHGPRWTLRPRAGKRRVVRRVGRRVPGSIREAPGIASADEIEQRLAVLKKRRQTPFRRGSQALIKFERENNRRIRRVTLEEEGRLLAAGNPLVHMLIVAALDSGMRRGEFLDLRFGDIDWDRQLIHVRPEIAKSKKGRVVPIGTTDCAHCSNGSGSVQTLSRCPTAGSYSCVRVVKR